MVKLEPNYLLTCAVGLPQGKMEEEEWEERNERKNVSSYVFLSQFRTK